MHIRNTLFEIDRELHSKMKEVLGSQSIPENLPLAYLLLLKNKIKLLWGHIQKSLEDDDFKKLLSILEKYQEIGFLVRDSKLPKRKKRLIEEILNEVHNFKPNECYASYLYAYIVTDDRSIVEHLEVFRITSDDIEQLLNNY